MTRRVVLLQTAAPNAPAVRVLCEVAAGREFAALREQAALHSGRTVAGEHLRPECVSRTEATWIRFLWKEMGV